MYRQHTLLEKDAVSQEAYEQVATEYEKLMADIELVKANIAQTELRARSTGLSAFVMSAKEPMPPPRQLSPS